MAQFARPTADIVDGNWVKGSGGNVDMFGELDEAVASDADYVESPLAPSAEAMALGLGTIEDPQTSGGHTVRYRYQKDASGGAQIDLTVELRQGYVSEGTPGTLIHQEVHTNIPNGFTDGSFTLSGGEADAITDYSDLALRLIANQV